MRFIILVVLVVLFLTVGEKESRLLLRSSEVEFGVEFDTMCCNLALRISQCPGSTDSKNTKNMSS